jgi:hypothetical protein
MHLAMCLHPRARPRRANHYNQGMIVIAEGLMKDQV